MSSIRPISSDSRLFRPTAASEPKFTGDRINNVVPRHPNMIPDAAEALSARASSPLRKCEYHNRMFGGSGALSVMRGDAPLPDPLTKPQSSIRRGSDLGALSPSAHRNAQRSSGVEQYRRDSPARSRSGTPTRSGSMRSESATGVRRSGRANQQSVEPSMTGMWMAKPLSDGGRYTKPRKQFQSPSRSGTPTTGMPGANSNNNAATIESPFRTGRRTIPVQDHIVGCSVNVTTGSRGSTPHRIDRYHKMQAPFKDSRNSSPIKPEGGDKYVGLLGYGPSGKKRIDTPDTMELLYHTDDSWKQESARRGPQRIQGKSYQSVDVTDLTRYTPSELNEKPFKPSIVVMHGPPPFKPQSPSRCRSPARGVGAPKDHNIFPVATNTPTVPFPQQEMPVLSRTPGTYSPLRQAPPNRR